MKNRAELAKHFAELGFQDGVEVGVADGFFSEVICKANPGVMLYCVDPWEFYPGYTTFKKNQAEFDALYEDAKKRLEPLGCALIRARGVEAAKEFGEEELDFVFLDGDHKYDAVKEDIATWAPKVRIGGIVSGHDYYLTRAGNRGVIDAVDQYVAANGYELQTTDWDKENPAPDERQPSWYFVKTK